MDFQTIIVALIIIFAAGFVSHGLWRKVKSFSARSNCGNDCGCDSTKKNTRIQPN